MRALVLVAHPDDETIFFGGTMLMRPEVAWDVYCVTDGNWEGRGAAREGELRRACAVLGVTNAIMGDAPDDPARRLDLDPLVVRLRAMGPYDEIYTHGPLGDYGNKHHQDVSRAAQLAFPDHGRLMAPATNVPATEVVQLSPAAFAAKAAVLRDVYGAEFGQFLTILPASSAEAFCALDRAEGAALYGFLAGQAPLDRSRLNAHAWLADYLESGAVARSAQIFFNAIGVPAST